jgi:hypothetical protein
MRMSTTLATALLLATAGSAATAESQLPIERKPSLMLYFHKTLGAERKKDETPLTFGMRLQRDLPFAPSDSTTLRLPLPFVMLDLRHALGGRSALAGAGMLMWDSGKGSSSTDSSGGLFGSDAESWNEHRVLYSVLGVVAVAGVACAAKWGICEDKKHSSSTYAIPTGATPPGG